MNLVSADGRFDDSTISEKDVEMLKHVAVRPGASVAECASWCFLSPGTPIRASQVVCYQVFMIFFIDFAACDMFSFDTDSSTCTYTPNIDLKSSPFYAVTSAKANHSAAVFILQCDTSMENILINSDLAKGISLKHEDDGSDVRFTALKLKCGQWYTIRIN